MEFSRKILIIGAHGWLAQNFHKEFTLNKDLIQKYHIEIYGTYNTVKPTWLAEDKSFQLDLSSEESVNSIFQFFVPDVVVHLAAVSSPVKCHKEKEKSFCINCPTSFLNALLRVNPNCLFLFSSTDMVFDGENAPYTVTSETVPVNEYGRSKLAFEQEVIDRTKNGLILRLSNMLGKRFAYEPCGEKFLEWISARYIRREIIGLKDFEIRSFVSVDDVARLLVVMTEKYLDSLANDQSSVSFVERYGLHNPEDRIFHVGGPKGLSRLEVAQTLCSQQNTPLTICEDEDQAKLTASSGDRTSDTWVVYRISDRNAAIPPGELRSPRNIEMNVANSERVWSFTFRPLEDYILEAL